VGKLLQQSPLPSWIQQPNGILEIELETYSLVSGAEALNLFSQHDIAFQSWRTPTIAIVRIPETSLATLPNLAWVKHIQATSSPAVLENLVERTNHRINTIDQEYSTGLHYDGTGVGISEGDDGEIGFHIDFAGRLTNHTPDPFGTHGDHVAGIAAGGGNFDPTTPGNAKGADLHVYSNYGNLTNAAADHAALGVRVTTNSLGQGCNDGYDSDAQFSDNLILTTPSIMSVHSAGNSGATSCGGVGNGFYTITGGYKAGKNNLAVGNVTNADVIAPSSSKGPAEDGRLKPEVVAVGTDVYSTQPDNTYTSLTGTSMACPAVAGTLASLWQAYRDTHGNTDPRSDLMKAVLMNTADDLGNKGPDYTYGYGRVNARRAYEVLSTDQYFLDSTETFTTVEHYITVPVGTKKLKVMLYWHDPVGNTTAANPLVNNLNLRLKDDNSNIFLPWILNKSTNPALLDLPAVRGIDSVNNVEQVTIDSVTPGNYAILVMGIDVPFGPQTYIVTYEFITDSVTLTYPTGGEHFANGVTERIRWDADDDLGTFALEYSTDAGTSWTTISNSIPGTDRYYDWTPPSTLNTGQMKMRVTRGSSIDECDTLFTVFGVPTNLVVDTACDNIFHLSWDPVAGADGYILYTMGPKYMTQLVTTIDTSIFLNTGVNLTDTFYYAVAATNSITGAVGLRSIAYTKFPGEVNCIDNIWNVETILPFDRAYNCAVSNSMPIKVKLKNIGLKDVGNFPITYQINALTPVTETVTTVIPIGDSLEYTFTATANFAAIGNYSVKTWTHIWTDTQLLNDTSTTVAAVILPVTATLPVLEMFENPIFPPTGWKIYDGDTNVKWQKTLCFAGANPGNTHAAYMDFYNYNNIDATDDFETFQFDLTSIALDSVIMTFDISAAYNSLGQDTLSIWVSSDCGKSFQPTAYKKWGVDLATVGSNPNIFSPTLMSQWRQDQVDFTNYMGGKIFVRFRGMNRKGNNVYIDNINMFAKNVTPAGVDDIHSSVASVFPNPSFDGNYTVRIPSAESGKLKITLMNMTGQVIAQEETQLQHGLNEKNLNYANLAKGVYLLEINWNDKTEQVRITRH
jgi:hypothetical protein